MYEINASKELKKVMTDYFQGIKSPVAWCTSVGPAELLRSFGFEAVSYTHLTLPTNREV